MADFKCKSNSIIKNVHAVSVVDLLTVDVLSIGITAGFVAGKVWGGGSIVVGMAVVAALILLVIVHEMLNIPSNLNYFLGYGKPPHVFKVCKCSAPTADNTAVAVPAAAAIVV